MPQNCAHGCQEKLFPNVSKARVESAQIRRGADLSQCAVNPIFMIFVHNYKGWYKVRILLGRQAMLNYEDFQGVLPC